MSKNLTLFGAQRRFFVISHWNIITLSFLCEKTKDKMKNRQENNITLRPFAAEDAPTILSWCKDKRAFRLWSADRYDHYPAAPEEMAKQYEGENLYPMTAISDGEIVGHILLRNPSGNKDIVRLGFIIVDSEKRGQGYGKQMILKAIEHAKEKMGAKRVTLGVFTDNTSAAECYKAAGFKTVGTDLYTIDDEEWPCLEMEYELQ